MFFFFNSCVVLFLSSARAGVVVVGVVGGPAPDGERGDAGRLPGRTARRRRGNGAAGRAGAGGAGCRLRRQPRCQLLLPLLLALAHPRVVSIMYSENYQ